MLSKEIIDKTLDGEIAYKLKHDEFRCRCNNEDCLYTLFTEKLSVAWCLTRATFGKPLKVNSGYRCQKHNSSKEVGGRPKSKHLLGQAVDISHKEFNAIDKQRLKDILDRFFDVVIEYETFYHCHKN
jgi:uncharacterized protein YcbK (DUF882 family)